MEKNKIQKLRQQYMDKPPDGMSKKLVQNMSENDLLDMHYFLNEDLDEVFGDILNEDDPIPDDWWKKEFGDEG